jgi:hypothetical protein
MKRTYEIVVKRIVEETYIVEAESEDDAVTYFNEQEALLEDSRTLRTAVEYVSLAADRSAS